MAFQVDCFIRKNSKELRDKLEKLGHTICKCCEFDGADWLEVSCNAKMQYSVHGIGYTEKEGEIYGDITQEEVFQYFLKTTTSIDCGENEELFLALAALRDDTPINSFYYFKERLCKCEKLELKDLNFNTGRYYYKCRSIDNPMICFCCEEKDLQKATVEEIIQHFKEK